MSLVEAVERAVAQAEASVSEIDPAALDIEGMSGRVFRRFLNNLARAVPRPRYLEIGTHAGSTLCSALSHNRVDAVAIDDWSEFGGPRERCRRNVSKFVAPGRAQLLESDFRAVDYTGIGPFNLYLYDGPHEEADHRDGVVLPLPALDPAFVLMVDDWNWDRVRAGTERGIAEAGLRVVADWERRTTRDGTHPLNGGPKSDWHNGVFIAVVEKTAHHEGDQHG